MPLRTRIEEALETGLLRVYGTQEKLVKRRGSAGQGKSKAKVLQPLADNSIATVGGDLFLFESALPERDETTSGQSR